MLHIVHLIERRLGTHARPVVVALAVASGCALLFGLALSAGIVP